MTQLVPGEMIARKDGSYGLLAVGGGVVEERGDRVSIVTDIAIIAENVDEAEVKKSRQRAEARLMEKLSAEEVATINAS